MVQVAKAHQVGYTRPHCPNLRLTQNTLSTLLQNYDLVSAGSSLSRCRVSRGRLFFLTDILREFTKQCVMRAAFASLMKCRQGMDVSAHTSGLSRNTALFPTSSCSVNRSAMDIRSAR